jgi:hypothetical protein
MRTKSDIKIKSNLISLDKIKKKKITIKRMMTKFDIKTKLN